MKKLGDVFKISKGKKAIESSIETELRYIQIGDLRNDNIMKYAFSSTSNVLCTKDDVLIAWDGANAGTVGYNLEGVIGSTLAKLTPKIKELNIGYVGRFLQSKFSYLREHCTGATIPHLSRPVLEGIQIPLPPLHQQHKIANILDAADALRRNDKALLAKYDELTQALFLDMFGDPVSNPKGWGFSTIEKILISKSQNGHYATKDEYIESGVEMVHMSDAFYQKVIPGNLKTVKCDDKLLSKYILKSTDLLISRRSLTYEGAAKPCFIPLYERPLIYESSLIKLSPNLELINNVFLFYFLSNQRARSKYILIHVTKSTISGINNKGLNSIQVILPPIDLQDQFAERVALIEEQKAVAQASLIKSEELFNSLLQKAFKGELA